MNFILKYIPLISGLLLFLGYLNIHTFYNQFDIEIISFLTTGELLLSFLPLTLPLLILAGLYVLMLLMTSFIIRTGKNTITGSQDSDLLSLIKISYSSFRDLVRNGKYKTLRQLGWLIINFISLLLTALILAFFLSFPFVIFLEFIQIINMGGNDQFWIVNSLAWLSMLFSYLNSHKFNSRLRNEIKLIVPIALFITILIFSNQRKATRIRNGDSQKVSALLETQIISTGSDTIFLGMTNNYIFFYLKDSQSNLIIPTTEVIQLSSNMKK